MCQKTSKDIANKPRIIDLSKTETTHENENNFEDIRDGPYSWFILTILFFIKSVIFGTFITYGLLFAEILKQGDLTREQVSWQFSTITTTENISCLFVSFLSVYISWRQSEFIAALLGTIGNIGAFFSRSKTLDIILIGIVGGLCQAFAVVPLMAINNAYFKKYRSTAYGISNAGPYCGALVLQYLVRNAIENFGISYGYLVLGLANSISLVLTPFITKPQAVQRENCNDIENVDSKLQVSESLKVSDTLKIYLLLLKKPYFHLIWITQLIFYWHYSSMSLLIVDYGNDHGLTSEQSSNLLMVYTTTSLLGRLLPGSFLDLDYLHVRYMISITSSLTGLSLILMTLTPSAVYWAYLILIGLLGFIISFLFIIINLLYVEYVGEHFVSISFGLASFIDGLFMSARPLVIGYFRDHLGDYNRLFQLMYSVCIVVGMSWLIAPTVIARFKNYRS